jgi:hypothetical protein
VSSFIVIIFVLSQYCEHSLFNDALHIVIIMSLKLREKAENPFIIHDVILNNDPKVDQELLLLAFKKVVCDVMETFLLFLKKYEKIKAHNILCLVLNPRHKSFFSFIACEQGKTIVEEYDERTLLPMLLKCH